jgi:PAS domain S-box-containing protein
MPDAVQIVEVPSLKTVFANGYARTITERILGRRANLDLNLIEGEVLHPDGRRIERADWPLMRATRGEKVADQECVYRLPDGTSMKFRISSAPVYDADGGIVAAVAVGRDITEHEDPDSASL